jgi:hypothetical protein
MRMMRKRPTLPPPRGNPPFFLPPLYVHALRLSPFLRFLPRFRHVNFPSKRNATHNTTQRNICRLSKKYATRTRAPPHPSPTLFISASAPSQSIFFSGPCCCFGLCILLSSVFRLLPSVFCLPSSVSACPCPGPAPACPGYLPQCAPLPSSSSSFAYATPCPPPPFQFNSTTCLLAAAVSSYCLLLRCSIAPPAPCMFCVSYQIDPAPQASNCQFYSPLAPHLFCSIFCFASPPAAAAPLCQLYYIPPRPRRVNCVTHAKNDNNPKTKKEKHHFTSNNKTNFIRYESYLPMYLSQSLLLRREIFFSCCMHSLEFLKWVTTVRRP